MRGAILTFAQILGAIAGSALVQGLLGALNARTTLGPGTSVVRGLFLEMFLTVSSKVERKSNDSTTFTDLVVRFRFVCFLLQDDAHADDSCECALSVLQISSFTVTSPLSHLNLTAPSC